MYNRLLIFMLMLVIFYDTQITLFARRLSIREGTGWNEVYEE